MGFTPIVNTKTKYGMTLRIIYIVLTVEKRRYILPTPVVDYYGMIVRLTILILLDSNLTSPGEE